jgi:hypothetical protein
MTTETRYVRTHTDLDLGGSPSVDIDSAHAARSAAVARQRAAGGSVLPVWDGPMGGPRRRAPKPGDRCGTYRTAARLYVVGPEVRS